MTITLLLPAIVALIGTVLYFFSGSTDTRGVRQWAMALVLAGMIGVCLGNWGNFSSRPTTYDRR